MRPMHISCHKCLEISLSSALGSLSESLSFLIALRKDFFLLEIRSDYLTEITPL